MLRTDAANWTAAVGDSTVEDKTTDQSQSLNLSSLASNDSDNGESRECPELEALRRIYEQICTIRNNHAQIVAENAAKRSEIQQRLDAQKNKLEELEAEHLETSRSMKGMSVGDDQNALMLQYQSEQQELEYQRHILEDLEFQMFEVDTQYDEQKEQIQQQLVLEQQMISDVDRLYSANTDHSCATTTATTTQLSPQPDCINGDVDCVSKEFEDNSRLEPEDDCDEEHYSIDSDSEQTDTTVSSCALTTLTEESPKGNIEGKQEPAPDEMSLTGSSVSKSDVIDACRQRVSSSSSSSSFNSLPVPDLTLGVTGQGRHQTPPVTPISARQGFDYSISEVDATTMTSVRHAIDERLPQQQADEVERRVSVNKRLQFQQQTLDDDVVLRSNDTRTQSVQSRPLTRYLPVRGEPLDLRSFVEQAGHFVDRCAADISVTSDRAAGFLVKMGGRIKTWRRRWFVFDRVDRQFVYYADQLHSTARQTRRQRGSIHFSQIADVFVFDRLGSIKSPAPELTFCVKTTSRTYYIVAPSSEVRQLWMEIIFTGAEGYREFF